MKFMASLVAKPGRRRLLMDRTVVSGSVILKPGSCTVCHFTGVVFLALAALYESWSIPFSVMLVVPLGVVGALLATNLPRLK
ncbi:efflux RND transporter permease subunit [Shigella flexneri]